MKKVSIIGVGMSSFGKGQHIKEMAEIALWEAFQDSGISPQLVEAAYCGNVLGSLANQQGIIGQIALREIGITKIPIVRVENACASASFAFKQAWLGVASGMYDIALAIGIEKMTGVPTQGLLNALGQTSDNELEGQLGISFPGVFGMIARRHMHDYGTTREQIAQVAVKNHFHASLNSKAHFQNLITVEEVLNARMIADPLTLLDCCPISDGCAVAILANEKVVKRLGVKPIYVAASEQVSGTYSSDLAITSFEPTVRAAAEAYKKAGIGPKDVDLAEVHDCFSVAEIVHSEDLGFCPKGEGGILLEKGETRLGGRIPINCSGGLLVKGHPIGATGIAQIIELYEQLKGVAGQRQISGAKVGLAQCLGGFTHADVGSASVTILTT